MRKLFIILALVFFAGCLPAGRNQITQTSTIDALLAGVYDGDMTCGQLLKYGDFGIGTFDRLDGEMLVYQGRVYQIKSDGKVYLPAAATRTPFAAVCDFKSDMEFSLKSTDYKAVQASIDEKVPNQNLFAAVEIVGKFKHIKVRSVPAQNKPYPPLAQAAEKQSIFEMNDVSGVIVGFRTPQFVKGVNVPGCHFHFLSDDRTQGGHILDFELIEGSCKVDLCNKFLLLLPENDSLKDIDLSQDKSAELHKVEQDN
ncbi:MAG TPA: acetolactate decarboxylase [Phycisphaerales bacterium]|nr:MAG: alpha-acetolactate decarboxylase [Planctomycetes bacterium GWC2_45_44]HBG77763.1 acetolactate decarboxylase [Phycisphaerales bacterium]HBR20227.1 acetolactate decarboxylase [Phycisphaerales bacterium]